MGHRLAGAVLVLAAASQPADWAMLLIGAQAGRYFRSREHRLCPPATQAHGVTLLVLTGRVMEDRAVVAEAEEPTARIW
ncbi:hypothetical protein D3C71_1010100 [compost metagenome]